MARRPHSGIMKPSNFPKKAFLVGDGMILGCLLHFNFENEAFEVLFNGTQNGKKTHVMTVDMIKFIPKRHGYSRHQKLPPQAFAKRGMAKLTAEEKVTSTSTTRMGLVYSMVHKEGTGNRVFFPLFSCKYIYFFLYFWMSI